MDPQVFNRLVNKDDPIAIVGLGYVGLPLACLLAEQYKVIGFDINAGRIKALREGIDTTREVEEKHRLLNPSLEFTDDGSRLKEAPVIIVAVPTPIDQFKKPDLRPILSASKTVGTNLAKGSVVVFESTVYPGVTENDCCSVIEEVSGMEYGRDFFLGYSPERVNPGDKEHTIDKIKKVVSGSTPEVLDLLCKIYGSVVTAGIHPAPTIRTAEAAKVIENAQRDINIGLMNELSRIFDRIGIDTLDVLEAAGTKWNFLPFRPGLVGGHCIGVDPYYLTYLAEGVGHHPQMIHAGRRINDNMPKFIAHKTLKLILADEKPNSVKIDIAMLGVTFKENVPDLRNSKVMEVVAELERFGANIHLVDPVVDPAEFKEEYNRDLESWDSIPECDALVVAVPHQVFLEEFPLHRLKQKLNKHCIVVDVKGVYDRSEAEKENMRIWRP